MGRNPISITLDAENITWLRGRVAAGQRRSLSDAVDEIVTAARLGGRASGAVRSVVGTIEIGESDPDLERADAAVAALFESSLARPFLVREERRGRAIPARVRRAGIRGARRRRG